MSLPPSLPQSRSHSVQTRSSAFEQEIAERAQRATASVERATADGEDYLAEVHLAELESLVRLASEHDVELTAARDFLRQHSRVIDLTAVEDRAGAPVCGA